MEKLNNLIINVFERDEIRIYPPVFLHIRYTRKIPKDKDEEEKI